jgi:hypothetical protein
MFAAVGCRAWNEAILDIMLGRWHTLFSSEIYMDLDHWRNTPTEPPRTY